MRPLYLREPLVDEIRQHGRATYPDECCGFLIARPETPEATGPRRILATQRAANEFEGERRRRFVIGPEELRSTERALEETDRMVAGFYHSHPDHPARPSAFDQAHAWPWYSYLIISVSATDVPAMGAFELDADSGVFHEVPLTSDPAADARVTESLSASGGR